MDVMAMEAVWTLTVQDRSKKDAIRTYVTTSERAALYTLREWYEHEADVWATPDEDLLQELIDSLGLVIYIEEHTLEMPAPTPPRIEILTVRDPDGPTYVQMFVDGVETSGYTEYDVDAGAGHMRSDWDATTAEIKADEALTPAFKAAVLAARAEPPGRKYIVDDDDYY
jgi:hypothetical protein